MPRTWSRPAAIAACSSFVVAMGGACAGARGGPTTPGDPPSPAEVLVREAPTASGPLVFPPPPEEGARRPRRPLPPELAGRDAGEPLRVVEPELDAGGAFSITGQRLRITLDQPVARPAAAKAAAAAAKAKTKAERARLAAEASAAGDAIRITPAVAAEARWVDDRTIELVAKKPFDPEATYAVELAGDLATSAGKRLAQPWKATFQATPAVSVAGKVISYLPAPGRERPIALHPSADRVGAWPELSAVFDQPIDLALARTLVRLEDRAGAAVPFVVAHPAVGRYQGVDLDPRLVVLIRPARRLAPDERITLTARGRSEADPSTRADFTVARELAPTALRCDYGSRGDDPRCPVRGDLGATDERDRAVVRTEGREVHVLFDNGLAHGGRSLASRVRVTPRPKNLGVRNESWDEGRIVIEAAFEPSRRYEVAIEGLEDRYGGKLARPVRFAIETAPLSASASMPEGLVLLDEARTKRFAVTTRNVAEAELCAWPVPADDATKLGAAIDDARARVLPSGDAPVRLPIVVKPTRDREVVTAVDLSKALAAGATYVATLRATKLAFGAEPTRFPAGSEASKPPVAVLGPGDARSLAVHARSVGAATIVHVARFGSGEPVAGASVRLAGDDDRPAIATDASGVAIVPVDVGARAGAVLDVRAADARAMLPIGDAGLGARELFPDLAAGDGPGDPARRAVVLTDRGIYRPGSTVEVKATLRRPDGARLVAIEGARARLRLVGPTGEDVATEPVTTSDTGGVVARLALPADAKIGRHQVRLEDPDAPEPPLARALVHVAEFEAPRFAVDVVASEAGPRKVRAVVKARYLFGAPMGGAAVRWTLRRQGAPGLGGPLGARGLAFARGRAAWLDEPEPTFTRAGEATLGPDGAAVVEQAVEIDPRGGPQDVTIEADVADASFRHVAGRASVRVNPARRYAGVRVASPWVGVGADVPIELGVVDPDGKPLAGLPVVARVRRLEYRWVERRAAGGALRSEWVVRRTEAGRCAATSAPEPATCRVRLAQGGDYEIEAEVDGRPGGATTVFAWRDGDREASPRPRRGHVVEVVPDRARYAPGDTAKLLVRSPFAAATAILAVEQGGLLRHEARRIEGPSAVFDVKLAPEHAPWVHATVTLLPIGAKDAAATDWRVGAARLPVSLDAVRLDVAVASDKAAYEPGETATLTIDTTASGKPAPSEIALAVVDEGVLRLTGFHAPDPSAALRPGRALDFRVRDGRQAFAEAIERSHVAGDGGGGEAGSIAHTRRSFVETAFFKGDLRTDAAGRAVVTVRLPDNLGQWRVSAVAIDADGRGGVAEGDFTVRKPLMIVPAVPRFALVGDAFEAAAMVHNEMDRGADVLLKLGDRTTTVAVAPHGKARVGFPIDVRAPGELLLRFEASDRGGPAIDRVEARVRVEEPGLEERPRIDGAFVKAQEITLEVPASAKADPGGGLTVLVGQHLWPELGERLDYLLGYPHGCVEQTTSSTLPLIAARTILPRIGFARLTPAQIDERIRAGLERLASMRTSSGGLAYWPGGDEPNVYGTAYAIRAVALAKQAGVEPPKGLYEGMTRWLGEQLLARRDEPEVAAAIAESLAEQGALPPAAPDALWDRHATLGVFGLGSLANALARTPGQDDRVAALLDAVEAGFDDAGRLRVAPAPREFHYYGSSLRTRAQAAIALGRLRPGSKLVPVLLRDLVRETGRYTTQATAWSLLALADHLRASARDGAAVRATLDGAPIAAVRDLGGGGKELRVPLEAVRGRKATLRLEADGDAAIGFLVRAAWRRPLAEAGTLAATSARVGPDLHRVFTDPKGAPVDLAQVKAGDVLRVALVARLPTADLPRDRLGYVAITDRLPAGFEPIQPDLATVASAPDLGDEHPLASLLRSGGGGEGASFVELRDDRVNVYFDRTWRDEVAATYLVRATTPGRFTLPPAVAELMYEGDSTGATEAGQVVVR